MNLLALPFRILAFLAALVMLGGAALLIGCDGLADTIEDFSRPKRSVPRTSLGEG